MGVWQYDQEPESLEQAVHQAVGGASACWDNLEGAGVFRDREALEVSQALIKWVNRHYRPIGVFEGLFPQRDRI